MKLVGEEDMSLFYEKRRSVVDLSKERKPSLIEELIDEDEDVCRTKKLSENLVTWWIGKSSFVTSW